MLKIPEGLCQNCKELKTATLGKSTQYVGAFVFSGTQITDLFVAAELTPVVSADGFRSGNGSITTTCTLHVPAASILQYRYHADWGKFNRIVPM